MANANAAVAKTHLTHARRRSTMTSQTRPRCTQRLSQFAPNILTQLLEHAINGGLHLGGRSAALELVAQRVKKQLRLACFARRDQWRDLVPVCARLIKFGLGLSRVPGGIRRVDCPKQTHNFIERLTRLGLFIRRSRSNPDKRYSTGCRRRPWRRRRSCTGAFCRSSCRSPFVTANVAPPTHAGSVRLRQF